MTSQTELEAALHDCIVSSFLSDGQAANFDNRTDLLGVLDSLQLLRLVVQLESRFGVKVSDHELTPENLGTVERMAAFVQGKQREAPMSRREIIGAR